jgi:hypothetical protein
VARLGAGEVLCQLARASASLTLLQVSGWLAPGMVWEVRLPSASYP